MRANVIILLLLLLSIVGQAQTNPAAQTLPYSMTSASSMPAGMATWRFGTSSGSIPTTRTTGLCNGDLPAGAGTTGGYSAEGANGLAILASGSNAAGAIVLAINTTGLSNITVTWTGRTIANQATRDCSLGLQYRIGTSGNFIDVTPLVVYQVAGASTPNVEVLPAAANNQPLVQIRWVYWEHAMNSGGSRDRLAVDDISVTGSAAGCSSVNPGSISSSTGINICGTSTNPTLTLGGGVTTGTGITYQWQSSTDSVSWTNVGTSALTYAPGSITTTMYYRAVTTCGTSGAKDSASIGIHINPQPTAAISGATTICAGANTDITFTGTDGATVTYDINNGADLTTTLTGGTATINTGALTANTTYRLINVINGPCTQTYNTTVLVTVQQLPTASLSPATTICIGGNTDVTFTGTPNAVISYNIDGGTSQTVTLSGAGTATVNTGVINAATTFNLESATVGTCSQTLTGSTTISVVAIPTVVISGDADICTGGNADITFTGTPNAIVTYTINGGANQTVTLDGTGNATVNSTALTATAAYSLVSVATGSCSQTTTGTATITVLNPTASISGATTICSGTSTNITFTGSPNATVTYTVNGGANQTIILDGTGNGTVSTGTITADATYALVSATLSTCTQPALGTVVVTVNNPTAAISGTATICSGGNADITFTGTPNATVTYTVDGGSNQTVTLDGTGNAIVNSGAITANTTFALVDVTSGPCTSTLTGNAVVTVGSPSATISGTSTICAGGNATITFAGTPNATVTYTVDGGANQTVTLDGSGDATVNTGAITANTTYALVSIDAGTCSATLTGTAIVTVNPMPTATISGTTTICSGNSVNITFTGTANAIVTYNINGGANTTITLDGAGTATVATGNLSATTTYNLVSVALGTCSQTQTGSAVVTVNTTPTATISGTATICSGGNSNITFTGTPNAVITYNINGGANTTVTLSGSGTATVNTGAITANATYSLVSAMLGTCSATLTGSVTVTVNAMPTATISGTTTICSGNGVNITFNGTANAIVTYNINGGANTTVTLNGTGTATIATGNLSATATYNLVSVALGTCSQTQTGSAVVTVNTTPTATISGTATICSGGNSNITFTGTPNAVVTYNINGGANTTVTLSGTGTATVNTGAITANATYALVDATLGTCSATLTGSVTVTVNTMPTATISGTTTICSGNGVNITFNGTPNAVVTYNINGGANTTITLNGTGTATLPTGNLSATATYNLVNVTLGTCSQTQTGSAVVTVNTTPAAAISGTATICSGGNSNITFTGTPNAVVTYNINGGTNTTATIGVGGTVTVNTGALTANATYNLVNATLGTCSATLTGSVTVTVNSLPTATISGTATICSGGNSNITFTGTPNAVVTYNINGGTNTTVTLSGAGTAIVNTGAITANATYNLVSATLNSCPQTLSGSAVITVNPIPTASIAGTTTICSGSSATITFVGTPNAVVTYNINGGTNTTTTLSGAGIATVSTGTLTANATYNLVSVSLNTCSQTLTGSALVTVSPLPTATISGATTICSGTGTTITFNGTANSVVTYNVNGGVNTTITLNGTGSATLATGNLTANTTYNLVSASLNSCSQSQTGSAVVTVNPLPTATISGTTTICSGTTTNITFNGTANAIVTYNINGGANMTVTLNGAGTASVATSVLTANTTYDLVSVSLNSCTQTQSGSAVITVTPLPTATILGTTTICSGNTVAISFNGTPNAVVTYNIDGGANQTVTLDALGAGTVVSGVLTANTVYDLVSITGNGCGQALTGSAIITVTPLPVATISGTATICAGDNTDIIFNGTPNAMVGYNEDGGATQTITLDGAGTAILNTGALNTTKIFNLVQVDLGACGQILTDVATVTVNPLPTVTISGTTTVCSGTDADITFTGTPNAIVTYNVNGGANTTVTLDAAGSAVVNTGSLTALTTYDLVSVNSGICTANVTGTATVSVNVIPTATMSGAATICSGNSNNMIFNGTPNAVVTYTINSGTPQTVTLDGTGLATVNTGILTGDATYSLVSVSLNTCAANLSGNATVAVLPAPTVTVMGSVTLAAGENTDITFVGTPNAVVSYTINGGAVQTVTLDPTGNATVNTGVLFNTLTYDLVDITLGCTTTATGSATVSVSTNYGTLYQYTNAVNGDLNFVATDATATDLTLYNGAMLSGSPCGSGFTTENYSSAANFDASTNAGVTAKITPDGMNRLVITGFTVSTRRSADGPQYVRLAYSLDNGANWITNGIDEQPNNAVCGSVNTFTWNVTPFQIYPNADGIIFGVFGFDAAATTGQLQIIDMAVNGAVIPNPLPITLTYFKGNCIKGDITCKWGVSYEENISEYNVEYSADGKTFNNVATIAPYHSQQIGEKTYSTIIYNAAEGLYRLASVEMDGIKEYSKAVRVKCDNEAVAVPTVVNIIDGTLNMWPGSAFTTGTNIGVQLFNMNGSQIADHTISSNGARQQVRVSLPAGVYMVRLVQGSTVSAHKVVVQ